MLLEANNDRYQEARDVLARFAELIKGPEYVHTYRITTLSLRNAASAGLSADEILDGLERYGKYPVPDNVRTDIAEFVSRYGRVRVHQDVAVIEFGDDYALEEMRAVSSLDDVLVAELSPRAVVVPRETVMRLVGELEKAGYTPKRTDAV